MGFCGEHQAPSRLLKVFQALAVGFGRRKWAELQNGQERTLTVGNQKGRWRAGRNGETYRIGAKLGWQGGFV